MKMVLLGVDSKSKFLIPDVRLFGSKKQALMFSSAVPQTDEGRTG